MNRPATILAAIALLYACMFNTAFAGGSMDWVEVSKRLAKDCPQLLQVIDACFEVNHVGGAVRLGPGSLDVVEGRAVVGTRVPP